MVRGDVSLRGSRDRASESFPNSGQQLQDWELLVLVGLPTHFPRPSWLQGSRTPWARPGPRRPQEHRVWAQHTVPASRVCPQRGLAVAEGRSLWGGRALWPGFPASRPAFQPRKPCSTRKTTPRGQILFLFVLNFVRSCTKLGKLNHTS